MGCTTIYSCIIIASSIIGTISVMTQEQIEEFMIVNNKYRCMHDSGMAVWDDCVADSAQAWADEGEFRHDSSYSIRTCAGPAGENLARGHDTILSATTAWYNEVSLWEGSSKDAFLSGAGHFTAMIWKGAKKIGCGINGRLYVCRYKGDDGDLNCNTPNLGGCYTDEVLDRNNKSEQECEEEARNFLFNGGGGDDTAEPPIEDDEPPVQTPSPPTILPNSEIRSLVVEHNTYRCMHDTPPVVWDACVAGAAQSWAERGVFQHDSSYTLAACEGPAGENLAKGHSSSVRAIRDWYNEVQHWEAGPGTGFLQSAGHFTAMIWRDATSLGCGIADGLYVCRYKGSNTPDCSTPNMGGCYVEQVLKRNRSKSESQCRREATAAFDGEEDRPNPTDPENPPAEPVNPSECFQQNRRITAPTIRRYFAQKSAEECQTKCVTTEQCAYFTYVRAWYGTCLLKSEGKPYTTYKGMISGPRVCGGDDYGGSNYSFYTSDIHNRDSVDRGYGYGSNPVLTMTNRLSNTKLHQAI